MYDYGLLYTVDKIKALKCIVSVVWLFCKKGQDQISFMLEKNRTGILFDLATRSVLVSWSGKKCNFFLSITNHTLWKQTGKVFQQSKEQVQFGLVGWVKENKRREKF